jgi:hypothetical protein
MLTSILAFTSWFFSVNNYGNLDFATIDIFNLLPTEFHTTASAANPSTRFVIDRQMLVVYAILQAIPLVFC